MKKFTLIEILVTISIITVLLSLVFPLRQYIHRARILEAKTDMKRIQTAILDYYQIYKKLPIPTSMGTPVDEAIPLTENQLRGLGSSIDNGLYQILSATELASPPLNSRGIKFYESSGVMTSFNDPWERLYQIFIDYDYDKTVDLVSAGLTVDGNAIITAINGRVVIYSQGLSTSSSVIEADINSWQ